MTNGPTELLIFDFDGTLYHSPKAPEGHTTWPFQVYSLDGWGPPGFDRRWNLTAINAARHAQNQGAVLAILTARPDYAAMRSRLEEMLHSTGLNWNIVQLRPVYAAGTHAAFKAHVVQSWLSQMPHIRAVSFWEDSEVNLEAVRPVVETSGRRYFPRLVLPG
jgi:hypothetical protein